MNVTDEQLRTLYQLIREYTLRGKPLLYAYTAQQGLVESCIIAIFGKRQLIVEQMLTTPHSSAIAFSPTLLCNIAVEVINKSKPAQKQFVGILVALLP